MPPGVRGAPGGAGARRRDALTVVAVAVIGTAGSVAVGLGPGRLLWGRLGWDVSALPGDAIGSLVLAWWCVRLVRRRRCVADHRPYVAVGVGLVACAVSAAVQVTYLAALVGEPGALWNGFWQLLALKMFGGAGLWPIVYAGLVLWRLCRARGHVHARPRYGREDRGRQDRGRQDRVRQDRDYRDREGFEG